MKLIWYEGLDFGTFDLFSNLQYCIRQYNTTIDRR